MNSAADATLNRYIETTRLAPRLGREEELELAQCYLATRDEQAKHQLVATHLRYVVAIALKYRRYGLPLGELIAEGNFGLVHALDKFEPGRGHRFVTYAAYWIRAYVLNYIIRSWSLVGVGSGALRSKMFFKLRRERVRITNLVGEGEEASQMLAKQLNVTPDKLADMMGRLELRDVSLSARVFDDSATTLGDTLADTTSDQEQNVASSQMRKIIQQAVRDALGGLDNRERYIAEKRLMADAEEQMSLAEIGRRLGVSRERARQLEARAKRKLAHRISELSRQAGDWLELEQELAA